jgi:hypothetical protein
VRRAQADEANPIAASANSHRNTLGRASWAELEFLRGSAPAYTVAQMPPPLPAFAAPPPLPLAGQPPVLVPQVVTVVRPAVWNWTGFYLGANAGLAVATTNFADPFGASVFGDTVRSPGFMAGGTRHRGRCRRHLVRWDNHLLCRLRSNHQCHVPGAPAVGRDADRPHRLTP